MASSLIINDLQHSREEYGEGHQFESFLELEPTSQLPPNYVYYKVLKA